MIPPDANAAFVATMEDVLEVYQRPHDPQRPLVCLDETSKQLIIETRAPIPAKPGQPARHDYEYERNGVANLFMVFAPLEGWRHVKVTDRHTAIDYAHVLRDLSDTHFPDTAKIVLVQDNLNIHKPASLYEAFPAPEARRLVERFEWHYTPKHGSWLDLAESELGVLASQCLDRRIADKQILAHEVTAWQDHRNKHHAKADAVTESGCNMKKEIRQRARQRLDERLLALKGEEKTMAPPKGWVRAIRDALGMTGVQFAKRLGIRPQSVDALETSEANGSGSI